MEVFISWSGPLSQKIALILKDWLPNVIQCLKPYVSSEDISKGSRWTHDISSRLDNSSYGIICLTKYNIAAPWINFEAGALGKSVSNSKVCPFLFDLNPSDIQGPISSFQSTDANSKDDVFRLVSSINESCGAPLEKDRLITIFNILWVDLEEKLLKVREEDAGSSGRGVKKATQSQILEEILEISRSNFQLLRDPSLLLPEKYLGAFLSTYLINSNSVPQSALWANEFQALKVVALNLVECLKSLYVIDDNLDSDNISYVQELVSTLINNLEVPINYMTSTYLGRRDDVNNIDNAYKQNDGVNALKAFLNEVPKVLSKKE